MFHVDAGVGREQARHPTHNVVKRVKLLALAQRFLRGVPSKKKKNIYFHFNSLHE